MSMTKKDYVAIAAKLLSVQYVGEAAGAEARFNAGVHEAARALAQHFASDNQRFDRARFLEACGVK
jgi:hypothetical protein